jgi:hypothetical protein
MLRRRSNAGPPPPPADPVGSLDLARVPSRLRSLVEDAVAGERRWRRIVGGLQPGPVADRLIELAGRVVAGVLEIYAVAVRVGEVEQVLDALEPTQAAQAFKTAKRRAADGEPVPELEALEARFASVQRMLNVVDDAGEQLRVLEARLMAAVAQGAELAITADPRGLTTMGADLDAVVGELGSLRGALVELR